MVFLTTLLIFFDWFTSYFGQFLRLLSSTFTDGAPQLPWFLWPLFWRCLNFMAVRLIHWPAWLIFLSTFITASPKVSWKLFTIFLLYTNWYIHFPWRDPQIFPTFLTAVSSLIMQPYVISFFFLEVPWIDLTDFPETFSKFSLRSFLFFLTFWTFSSNSQRFSSDGRQVLGTMLLCI